MELRHLRYFVAVAEMENVSRAAQRLHVSQPALSRQIRDLEDDLGFMLLERGPKSVRLTSAGRVFLREAKAVLARADEAVEKGRAEAGAVQGELSVGYAPSPTVQILPRTLREFQSKFPRVRVVLHDLSAEEMVSGLASGLLNVAMTVRPEKRVSGGLRFVEVTHYPFCLAVHPEHKLASARVVDVAMLQSEQLLGYSRKDYPDYYARMEALLRPLARKPRFIEEHDSVNSLIAGVEAERGVAIVLSCVACIVGQRLRLIPLKPAGPPAVVGVLLSRKSTPLIENFVQAALAAENASHPRGIDVGSGAQRRKMNVGVIRKEKPRDQGQGNDGDE
jgi:DNA-binding transcriptional LysR family regulator